MNERLPYRDMRKLALLAREKIGRKRLLTEADRLLRNSRDLISGTQELKTLSADYNSKTRAHARTSAREKSYSITLIPTDRDGRAGW